MHWMHLSVPATTTLEALGEYFKEVWVDCGCGHASCFDFKDSVVRKWYIPHSDAPAVECLTTVDPDSAALYRPLYSESVRVMADRDSVKYYNEHEKLRNPNWEEGDVDLMQHMADVTVHGAISSLGLSGDRIHEGGVFRYQYDFGSTTELTVKLSGISPLQSAAIELMAMNAAPSVPCTQCGAADAEFFTGHTAHYACAACKEAAPGRGWFKIGNSPRMGVCAYGQCNL